MIQTLAVALALAAISGFTEAKSLEPAASFVAGKPVTVDCASTSGTWADYIASKYPAGFMPGGSTVPGSAETKLSDQICTVLRQQLGGKKPGDYALAVSLLGLVHESIHMRGEADEGVTDCAASHEMPRVAVKFFRVKTGKALRALMAEVAAYRGRESAPYRTVC